MADLSDQDWVSKLIELYSSARDARLQAEQRWDEAWRAYNNQWDWRAKSDWQSKNYVPRVSMTVEMAASLVRRAMLDSEEWFRLEGHTETARRVAPFIEKLLYYYLERIRFADRFIEPLKAGFVGSLIVVKPHLSPAFWSPYGLRVDDDTAVTVTFVDPYNIYLDPTGRNRWVIEVEDMDISTAYDLADAGVLDGDVLNKITEDWADEDRRAKEESRRQQSPATGRVHRTVRLHHFWGSIPGERRWMLQDGHFVTANEKYLIRKPTENPYLHGQIPYVIGSPFRRPFSTYHKGLVEDVVGLQRAMTEVLNLMLDSALFSGVRAFEVDLDLLEDPQEILSGLYPGKVFRKRAGGQPGTQLFREIQLGSVSRDVAAMYQLLNTEFQNSTAVTEFISGALGLGGRRTATEVIAKQHQGMGIFSEVSRNLEGTVLEPMLEQLSYLVVQYYGGDLVDDRVREIIGDELFLELIMGAVEDRVDRLQLRNLHVKASGITALLNRSEEIQRIISLLQTLGQFGPMLQQIFVDIDMSHFFRGLFRRLVRAHGWNERDILRPAGDQPPPQQPQPQAGPQRAVEPQEGMPAPHPVEATIGQIEQIQQAVAAGGAPPSPLPRVE